MRHLSRLFLLLFGICSQAFALTCPAGSTCWSWTFVGATTPGSTGTFTATESTTSTNLSGSYSIVAGTGFTSMTGVVCTGGGCPVPSSLIGVTLPDAGMILQPILSTEQQPIFNILPGACPTGSGVIAGSFVPTQWPAGGAGSNVSKPGQLGFGSASWDMSQSPAVMTISSRRNLVNFGELGAVTLNHDTCGTAGAGEVTMSGVGDRGGILAWLPNNVGFLYRTLANHTFWFVSQQALNYPSILYGKYAGFSFDPAGQADVKPVNLSVVATGTQGSGNALTDIVAGSTDASYSRIFTIPTSAGLVHGVTYPAGGGVNFPFTGMVSGTIGDGTNTGNLSCLVLPSGNGNGQSSLYCSGQSPANNALPYNLVAVMNTGVPGSSDPTFASGGSYQNHLFNPGSNETINDSVVQLDGKVLALGYATSGATINAALARLGVDGTLDTSFASGGIVQTQLSGAATSQSFQRGALQADGSIVAAGYSTLSGSSQSGIVRFTSSGAFDSRFASSGKWSGTFSGDNGLYDIKLQSDGRAVAVGWMYNAATSNNQFLVLRMTTTGVLDTAFAPPNGYEMVSIGLTTAPALASSLAIQSDGKIVVAGQCSRSGTGMDFCAARLTSTGALDLTFAPGAGSTLGKGQVFMAFSTQNIPDICTGVAIQTDGKIVLGGYTQISSDANPYKNNDDFALVRFTSNGSLDTTFNGTTGAVVTPVGTGNDLAQKIQVQSDGKIVLAGYCGNAAFTAWQYCAYRSNTDGTIDTTFGTSGTLMGQISGNSTQVNGFQLGQDGRFFFAGSVLNGSVWDTLVMRYWP